MFRMSNLKRTKSGAFKARKALPADIKADYQVLYGPGWEAIFSRPAGTPVRQAKEDHLKWLAEVEQRISALKAGKAGKGRDLTQREAVALAGEWYREYVAQHEDNPGNPDNWDAALDDLTTI